MYTGLAIPKISHHIDHAAAPLTAIEDSIHAGFAGHLSFNGQFRV